jgi:thiol:disulfide interchange protein DsbD
LPGVKKIDVDLDRDRFTVAYDETQVDVPQLLQAIVLVGYEPEVVESTLATAQVLQRDELPQTVQARLDQGVPVVLYFGADWCGACKIMQRTTFLDINVLAKLADYQLMKVDVETESEIAAALSVSAVPTVILLDSAGIELYRRVGLLSPAEMVLVLDNFTE